MTTANGFNAIVGQEQPIRLLKTLICKGTLPHALLFTGDEGVGKKMAAKAFAMACNCQTLQSEHFDRNHLDAIDACGRCIPCKKIAGNNHPDIIQVAPLTSVIRITQIRDLLQTLRLQPNEANRRVVVISEAQAMNAEAGNALLKMLEEPPDRTLLVLTARQTTDLLPTVVSRCRHIRFFPLRVPDMKRLLAAAGGVEPEMAETVATLCGGSYTRARTMTGSKWLNHRDWIIQAMGSLITNQQPSGVRAWLMFAEMLAEKKDRIEESLEIITMWLRDLLIIGVAPQRVLNRDRLEELSTSAKHVSQAHLLSQIEAVNRASALLRSNTNTRLTIDAMVLRMAGAGCEYK